MGDEVEGGERTANGKETFLSSNSSASRSLRLSLSVSLSNNYLVDGLRGFFFFLSLSLLTQSAV